MPIVLHTILIRIEKLDESIGWIVLLRMLLGPSAVMRERMMDAAATSADQGAHFHRTSPHVVLVVLWLLMVLQRMVVVMVVMMRQVIRWPVNIVAVHLRKIEKNILIPSFYWSDSNFYC